MQRDCLIIGIYLSHLTRLSRQVLDRPHLMMKNIMFTPNAAIFKYTPVVAVHVNMDGW